MATGGVKSARVRPNNQAAPGPIGNTGGLITPQTAPNPHGNSAPPIKPTKKEESWWSKWGDVVHTALDVVGMIPVVGEVADGANALIYVAEGDAVNAALSAASMLPVGGQAATAAKWGKKGIDAAQATKATAKVEREVAERAVQKEAKEEVGEASAKQGGGNKKGGKDKGKGRDCRLRKYKEGCSGGKTPHHVVPDRAFRMPSGQYFPGGLSHADGYTVCVDGGTPVRKGPRANEHGLIHGIYDPLEAVLGAKGNPKGTATLGELEVLGVAAAARVTGCNPVRMLAELRAHHAQRGLSVETRFRADPTGSMIRDVNPRTLGTGATSGGIGGI